MKRFDKGYIYSSLLSDLVSSFVLVFFFLGDHFFEDDGSVEDVLAALPVLAIAFAVIYLCFVAYRIMYYRTSGYELCEKEIKCNRGVLFRKRSVLEYKKVHAINKRQNLIHRVFGIAILTVDSGSTNTSHQAEITIVEKSKTVDLLLLELNELKENGTRVSAASNPEEHKEKVLLCENDSLYRFTSKKKMLYTLINIASSAFFVGLLGVLAIVVLGASNLIVSFDLLGTFLLAIIITVSAMLLFSAFSFVGCMIRSFVGYHNFTITGRGNDIQISYGLFERHTNTFSYDRIKAVKISQGIVQRMFGFASIKLEVIGYTNDSGDENNADIGVLVPFCKYDEIGEILGKILPDYVPDQKQTRSVSYFPFVSWFLLIFSIILCIVLLQTVVTLMIFGVSNAVIFAVSLAVIGAGALILAVKALSGALSYKNNGIAVSRGKITAYYGGFTRNVTVFLTRNLIAAENVTTPLRSKAGITSLVMHLKTNALSNEVKVHIQNDELSGELERMLIL